MSCPQDRGPAHLWIPTLVTLCIFGWGEKKSRLNELNEAGQGEQLPSTSTKSMYTEFCLRVCLNARRAPDLIIHGGWALNSGPLEEQPVEALLTSEGPTSTKLAVATQARKLSKDR